MIRKQLRLKYFNYNNAGTYFITICTINKQHLLGHFSVNNSAKPIFYLSNYGKVIKKYIENIELIYNNIFLDNYVIMPNHIHLLICSNTNIYIPNIIRTLKILTSKEIGKSIFQRSYHDHIIRNKEDYAKIFQYINDNPINWNKDIYFS